MIKWLSVLAFVLLPSYAAAQVVNVDVPADKAFTVAWDHDKLNTQGYRLYNNDELEGEVPATLITPTGVAMSVSANVLQVGEVFLLELVAYNQAGESARSGIQLTVVAGDPAPVQPPSAPTNPRVTIQ